MFWRQKATLICTTQQRSNALFNQFDSYMADKQTTLKSIVQSPDNPLAVIIQVNYVNQVDADTVWADVTTAEGNGWVADGFAGYASCNDDGSTIQLIDRIDWSNGVPVHTHT